MFKKFKGNKLPYIIRISAAAILFTITILAFLPQFKPFAYILQINIGACAAKLIADFSLFALILLLIHLLIAFLFGSFYCSIICPLGILQDIMGLPAGKRNAAGKNCYYIRYIILAATVVIMISGVTAILMYVDPYSNFGNIFTGVLNIRQTVWTNFIPLVLLAGLVLWKKRIFCTTICPVGTVLGLCAKFGYKKMYISPEICKKCGQCEKECPTGAIKSDNMTLDNERCIRCMRCIAKCPGNGIKYGTIQQNTEFNPSRRDFIAAGAAAAFAIALWVKTKDIANAVIDSVKKRPICPPGAGSPERLARMCTNCGLCVEHCKGKIIQKPDADYETIHIDFRNGKCEYDCKNCSDVCPTGAIKKLSLAEKQNCRIGLVKLDYEKCTKCGLCAQICPKEAFIHKAGENPEYKANKCIGCGACEKICPSKAIEIISIIEQTQI